MKFKIGRIISGGQTGIDQIALEAAIQLGIPTGGFIPRGRRSEKGRIPSKFAELKEIDSTEYPPRTAMNIASSDATLIIHPKGTAERGVRLTKYLAEKQRKPFLYVEMTADASLDQLRKTIVSWLLEIQPRILNCAGPRESSLSVPFLERAKKLFLICFEPAEEPSPWPPKEMLLSKPRQLLLFEK